MQVQFSRANALAAYKSKTIEDITRVSRQMAFGTLVDKK